MSDLYDTSQLEADIGFDDLSIGLVYPPYHYWVTEAHVDAYLAAVAEDDAPVREDLRTHPLLPTLVSTNYGFVYAAMRGRLPQGFLNASVVLDLIQPVALAQELTMTVAIEDKQLKRDRKHVMLRAAVRDSNARELAVARIGCVLP
jgi:hypothetical protein